MKSPAFASAILSACLVFSTPAMCEDFLKSGTLMTGEEIASVMHGMTMTGNYGNGVKFTETYHADGSITYFDDEGADKGRWFVRGNLFCTFYDTYNGACFSVRRSGANCYEYYTEQEEDGAVHDHEGAWNSVGWDSAEQSTCDLSDKTS